MAPETPFPKTGRIPLRLDRIEMSDCEFLVSGEILSPELLAPEPSTATESEASPEALQDRSKERSISELIS
jgi:hypothetical protein